MSTRSTIASGPGFHLYHELFDQTPDVYLRLDKADFSASPDQVIVKIPIELWEFIRKVQTLKFELVGKSDDDLTAQVKQCIQDRKDRVTKSTTDLGRAFASSIDDNFLGPIESSDEYQLAEGLGWLRKQRDEEVNLMGRIAHFAEKSKFYDRTVEPKIEGGQL